MSNPSVHEHGPLHPAFRGKRALNGGYVARYAPGHPRARNGYVREHILIAEHALGRFLPDGAVVHHADENRRNNENGNLVVCQDRAYHAILHMRIRALRACGDPSARRCIYCKRYDNQEDVTVPESGAPYHRRCATNNAAKARLAKGNHPGVANRLKTRCKRGHTFDQRNTYLAPSGGRRCRQCAKEKAS